MNHSHRLAVLTCLGFSLGFAPSMTAADSPIRVVRAQQDASHAIVRVRARERSPYTIPRFLTGKFCEHLGFNIYNGMDAQILRNPTFADYPFWTGQLSPDGVTKFHWEDDKINAELRRQATRFGWPEAELAGLVQARGDGLASFWTRAGEREAVQVSPDAGPGARRAQRVEVKAAGQGIAQWAYLPLHRQRRYSVEILARSPDLDSLEIRLDPPPRSGDAAIPVRVAATVRGLSGSWQKLTGELTVPGDWPARAACRLSVTANSAGQFVVAQLFLRPVDHIHGADPDVVRLLKESHLPLLRWPGGNFVSGYHWEDGIGPVEKRPTRPNYAWGGCEYNTFGTAEFLEFCQAVGCEPMICINAGSGTPEEAARWVEYCNGPANSPMGALRAAHGHPEPYHVKHWEVGNELWGRWQFSWTTASGYVDRYGQFAKALLAADPAITLYACGAPVFWGKQWNDTLLAGAAQVMRTTTDHPLIGGTVAPTAEPLDVYRDFMAVPEVLEQKWAALRDDMSRAGIKEPRLAVTELQMFAHLGRQTDPAVPARLTPDKLVNPGTQAEALYDVLIYHAAIRLAPFVSLVTHSATVNHGGGLRKEQERVYANPCHYAQAAFAAFAGATPVTAELDTAEERAPMVLPELKNTAKEATFGAIDALAAVAPDGALLLSLVHRGSGGMIQVSVELLDFSAEAAADVLTLTAAAPWAANTLESPETVTPTESTAAVSNGKIQVQVQPYSVVRVRVPKKG